MKVAYKPQYISHDFDGTVQDYLYAKNYELVTSSIFDTQVLGPLAIKFLMVKKMATSVSYRRDRGRNILGVAKAWDVVAKA
jgi:translation initiation factor RLI1